MSGETEDAVSAWTIDSLKGHYDSLLLEIDHRYEQRFVAQEQALALALTRVDKDVSDRVQQVRSETAAALLAADKAILKAEAAVEKRLEGMNEFRAQLSDQAATFLPRAEYDRAHSDLADRVEASAKGANEKLDQAVKTLEARMATVQSQVSNIQTAVS